MNPNPYRFRQFMRDARVSGFEKHAVLTGILLVIAAIVVASQQAHLGGNAWLLGCSGLGVFGLFAASRGFRLYRAGAVASMPRAVGRVGVRIRPRAISTALTVVLALAVPAAATVAFFALVEWAWLAIAGVLLFGGLGLLATAWEAAEARARERELAYGGTPPEVVALVERLCMRADMPAPEVVIESTAEANAWTTRGRLHLTKPLLKLLDSSELEAVIAHEVAHLAHRDSAVMDVCSAPARMLLRYAGMMGRALRGWLRHFFEISIFVPAIAVVLAALSAAPTFVLGWFSRLSVLHMSRSREFAADAAAATLTGRPSALASALMKLDGESDWIPGRDLREAQARAVLCIVGTGPSRLGRPFSTHPPTAKRVARLQALEERLQA